ncbi:MAG: 5-carboxymethyl-2-hydroxymuconate Delta-isomerase [Candidatus Berkiella sp.]
MPQITLEMSDNVLENELTELLIAIHHTLSEQLPTELRSCKSRMIRHQTYVIGDADQHNAFVHLSIGVIKGRSDALKNAIAASLMEKLKMTFAQSLKQLDCQITIAISDLPDVYLKLAHPALPE